MINLTFNPYFRGYSVIQRHDVAKPNLRLCPPLGMDTVEFTGKKKTQKPRKAPTTGTISEVEYKNVLGEPLISIQRPAFEHDLRTVRGLVSFDRSKTRVSSLSAYLKEQMVGFVVPKYEVDGQQKGGYQWFEQGAEYLLKGSSENVKECNYKQAAKELYGLLAIHDNYWKSPEFVGYLSTLKQTNAIKATIQAVKELNVAKEISFTGERVLTTYGYFSPLKAIDRLIKGNCAYSGEKFKPEDRLGRPSLDHIMPKSWGGPCDDANYILASTETNTLRGNIGLIEFLKGGNDTSSGY